MKLFETITTKTKIIENAKNLIKWNVQFWQIQHHCKITLQVCVQLDENELFKEMFFVVEKSR